MRTLKQLVPLAVAFAALVAAGPALAARGHEFTTTFSKPCTAEPCGEALKKPTGVAVNEATGDVYVVDTGSNRVARFSASGVYLGQFNGSGTFEVEGKVESGTPAGSLGRTGEIETGAFSAPEGIAVDNSCVLRKLAEPKLAQATCEAEDPSNGDVYVVDAGHRVVDKFAPDGEYLGQISEAEEGTPFSSEPLDGVAVDQKGTVWVFREHPVIDGFSNGIPNKFIEAIAVVGLGDFPLPGFAVDGEGNFYVRHPVGQNAVPLISKVSHKTGRVVSEEVDKEGSSAVATEQSNSDVLIDNLTSIGVFNSEGVELERLGAGELSEGSGIGVNAAAGSFYVADEAAGQVMVFGPQLPSPPRVEGESVTAVTSTSAQLEGEVNPRSEPGEAATEYHFEYGRCATASTCVSSPYEGSAPVPGGQLAADFDLHAVSAPIQGLAPSTTYHFRVLARNSHDQPGEYEPGEERTFTTEGPGGELVLPDNRGWELVSPPDKQGALIEPIAEGVVQAAAGGGGITYLANAPTEAAPPGNANEVQVLSRRGAGAWSSQDIAIAHTAATGLAIGPGPEYKFFDPELALSAVRPFGQFNPGLSPEASESTAYLHELSGSCGEACFQPLVSGKAGFANVDEGVQFGEEGRCAPPVRTGNTTACGPEFLGASEDLSHVVLRAKAQLKAGAGGEQLYEWAGGQLAPVSVLPDKEAAPEIPEARLGLEDQATRGAIAADGERIVWDISSTVPELYLRDMARKETVQLDKAETCAECESGGGRFQFASADGSRVLFTDTHKLTADSGAQATGAHVKADLYECRIVISGGELGCELSDLTPKQGEESAAVQGSVLGASEDGEAVYFVADGVLSAATNARGERAQAGSCEGPSETVAESSACNLYVRRGASTSFIARLSGADSHDWNQALAEQPTRVTADGGFLELMSAAPLTGYDNRDAASGRAAAEVYLYDAASGRLSCASCDPTGARPVGVEYEKLNPANGGLVGGPTGIWRAKALVAANVPGWTTIGLVAAKLKARHQPRYLSNEGRLFFNTVNALVPQDSNGTQDVYEFEPLGIKGPEGEEVCTSSMSTFSESNGGCVSLISSGRSANESAFMDASVSGDDVFFLTSAQLSPLDVDNARDIYDAHVCSAESPCISYAKTEVPPCTTEASCKASPTPQPSIFGAPASSTFQGLGNPAPVAAVKAKAKPLTRAQKLAAALKVCKRRPKKQRAGCQKQARKRYGPIKKAKKGGKR